MTNVGNPPFLVTDEVDRYWLGQSMTLPCMDGHGNLMHFVVPWHGTDSLFSDTDFTQHYPVETAFPVNSDMLDRALLSMAIQIWDKLLCRDWADMHGVHNIEPGGGTWTIGDGGDSALPPGQTLNNWNAHYPL